MHVPSVLDVTHCKINNKNIFQYILQTYIHTHTQHTYITYIHTYVHTYIHTNTCIHNIHTYTHIHTHTYIHTYIHAYILYTYIHTSSSLEVILMQVMAPLCSFMASFREVWPCRVTSHTRTCPSPPPLTSLLLLDVQARAVTPCSHENTH